MKKVKEEDFFFDEEHLFEIFDKDYIEYLKNNDYERYVTLRNSPCFMESDIIPPEEDKQDKLKDKYEDNDN